jgi:hypothetical protein
MENGTEEPLLLGGLNRRILAEPMRDVDFGRVPRDWEMDGVIGAGAGIDRAEENVNGALFGVTERLNLETLGVASLPLTRLADTLGSTFSESKSVSSERSVDAKRRLVGADEGICFSEDTFGVAVRVRRHVDLRG